MRAILILSFVLLSCSSCIIPAVTGLKQIKNNKDGSSEWNFITGGDLTVGLNGVDSVNNNRGIDPGK